MPDEIILNGAGDEPPDPNKLSPAERREKDRQARQDRQEQERQARERKALSAAQDRAERARQARADRDLQAALTNATRTFRSNAQVAMRLSSLREAALRRSEEQATGQSAQGFGINPRQTRVAVRLAAQRQKARDAEVSAQNHEREEAAEEQDRRERTLGLDPRETRGGNIVRGLRERYEVGEAREQDERARTFGLDKNALRAAAQNARMRGRQGAVEAREQKQAAAAQEQRERTFGLDPQAVRGGNIVRGLREKHEAGEAREQAARDKAAAAEAAEFEQRARTFGLDKGALRAAAQNARMRRRGESEEAALLAKEAKLRAAEEAKTAQTFGLDREELRGVKMAHALRKRAEREEAQKASREAKEAAAQARQAKRQQDAADRQNPEFYKAADIAQIGRRGQRAIRDRDYQEMGIVERELAHLEEKIGARLVNDPTDRFALAQQAAVKEARARVAASGGDNMTPGAGLLGLMGEIRGGPIGIGVKMAIEAASAMLSAPATVAKMYNGLLASAEPYRRLHKGSFDIGRAGGFDGQTLEDTLYAPTDIKQWMSLRGLTQQSSLHLLGQYGVAPRSADEAQGVLSAIGDAQFMPGLGGLGMDTYAKMLGKAQSLGAQGAGYRFGSGNEAAGAPSFFRDWQRTMTAAVAAGLDRSQVSGQIEGLMSHVASAGGANVDVSRISDYWWRMASGGAPMFRTGEGQMNAVAGMDQAIDSLGFGGGNAQNFALDAYFTKHPMKSIGDLGKLLKVDPSKLQGGQAKQFQDAFDFLRRGDMLGFGELIKPWLTGNTDAWNTIASDSGILNGAGGYRELALSNLTGQGPQAQYQYDFGGSAGARPLSKLYGPRDWAAVPDDYRGYIVGASNRTAVPEQVIAAVMAQESGGDANAVGPMTKYGQAKGLMQLMPGTAQDMHVSNPFDAKQSIDGGTNYLAQLYKKYGNWDSALTAYNEGPGAYESDSKNPLALSGKDLDRWKTARKYAGEVEERMGGFGNMPSKMLSQDTLGGQLDTNAGKQGQNFVDAASEAAPVLVKFTGNIALGTEAVERFIHSLLNAATTMDTANRTNKVRPFDPHAGGRSLLPGRANDPRFLMTGRTPP